MTIRLIPLLPSQVIGKITSRAPTKECIESEIDAAIADADNLAKTVDTAEGNFDKKKAKSTETIIYDEDDKEMIKIKKVHHKEGVTMPMFREMIKHAERALNLTEEPKSLTKNELRQLVKEEYVKILDEQRKGAVKIEKQLYELRDDLIAEMFKRTSTTKEQLGRPPMFKSLQLSTVSKLIDVPVNELLMYFLNNVKGSNHHHLVEYHIGHVYFYGN